MPVSQLHLVGRYTGPRRNSRRCTRSAASVGARQEEAAQKVRDVAAELLAIYAQREARQGIAMPIDIPMAEQFAASFPFEETPDQQQAIEA